MTEITIEDKSGQTMKLVELNGRRYPLIFPVESLKHGAEIEARPDDVLLVTYPKSGTHWASAIIRYLVNRSTAPVPDTTFMNSFVDMAPLDVINNKPRDSIRDLTTHFHVDTLSPDFLRKKSKIIYVTRNPRDAVTSFYHHHKKLKHCYHYDGSHEDHLHLFLEGKLDYGSWFEHTKGWERCIKEHPDHPFLVLSFEDLKQDPFGNIKKISEFIGLNHTDEFIREVTERTSFNSMKGDMDPKMGSVMLRKGQVGDWKNNFTVAQSEMFDEIFEREMAGTNAHKLYSNTATSN